MSRTEWEQIAVQQANRCKEELFEAHRGAYLLFHPNVFVIFGNDGHSAGIRNPNSTMPPDWQKHEAEIVRQFIENHPTLTLLAFGLDDGTALMEPGEEPSEVGYTWVCVLSSEDPTEIGVEQLNGAVWLAYRMAASHEEIGPLEALLKETSVFEHVQSQIADDVLASMCEGEVPPSLN